MPSVATAELLSPETLARIDSYSLIARTVVEGFISGLHRSLYHGFGSEFFQYRTYVPGDDPKYVDWKVYARQNRFYTKVFQEETNMNCSFVLDTSASMRYQGRRAACSKLRYASMVAASLAYLASRQGDNVGLYTYSNVVGTALSPGRGTGGLQRLLAALPKLRARGTAQHGAVANCLGEDMQRRGLVVVISDFLGDTEGVQQALKRFRFAHHECVALQVLDPDELDFPFTRTTRFVDSENGAEVATAPQLVREHYLQEMRTFLEDVRLSCLELQVDHLLMPTSENLGNTLAAYLHRRESMN